MHLNDTPGDLLRVTANHEILLAKLGYGNGGRSKSLKVMYVYNPSPQLLPLH